MDSILVLGSGELGHAIIVALHNHPVFDASNHTITATIRPSTLSSPSPSRTAQFSDYKSKNITLLPLNIETNSLETLTNHFIPFTTIIHAGGMTLSPGTQTKVTQAVLASASSLHPRKMYIPWQFGLDYDAIGPEAGGGLFAEQCQIRQILRSQTEVEWVIVSNGIFTSFMFEPAWGVVEPVSGTSSDDTGNAEFVVRALGSWDNRLVVTTAESIARCTAELVLADTESRGGPVFIAGDRLTYSQIAELVETTAGREVRRELWSNEFLEQRMKEEPENKLRKYHVVFAQGVGIDWNIETTYNIKRRIGTVRVESWLSDNFGVK